MINKGDVFSETIRIMDEENAEPIKILIEHDTFLDFLKGLHPSEFHAYDPRNEMLWSWKYERVEVGSIGGKGFKFEIEPYKQPELIGGPDCET